MDWPEIIREGVGTLVVEVLELVLVLVEKATKGGRVLLTLYVVELLWLEIEDADLLLVDGTDIESPLVSEPGSPEFLVEGGGSGVEFVVFVVE